MTTAALDLLREAREVLRALAWNNLGNADGLDLGPVDELLDKITALLDAPQESRAREPAYGYTVETPVKTHCARLFDTEVGARAYAAWQDRTWPGHRVVPLLDAPQVSHHCPACEASAREAVFGWAVVDAAGKVRMLRLDKGEAIAGAGALNELFPEDAPHRVVELVAREPSHG